MPTYKLTYFDVRGFAELTRLALCAANQKFEDVRVTSEKWKDLKPTTPQGKLPILEVDGKIVAQSGAMARYVAREHGLYGTDNMENTAVDVVLETVQDFVKERIKGWTEKDEGLKKKLMESLLKETVPHFLTVFEKMLGENEWIVGSELSLADLAIFNAFEAMEQSGHDIYEGHSIMKAHADRVRSNPEIKNWLDTRPKTDF